MIRKTLELNRNLRDETVREMKERFTKIGILEDVHKTSKNYTMEVVFENKADLKAFRVFLLWMGVDPDKIIKDD